METHEVYISLNQMLILMGILITSGLICVIITIVANVNTLKKTELLSYKVNELELNSVSNVIYQTKVKSLEDSLSDLAISINNKDEDKKTKISKLEKKVENLEQDHVARRFLHDVC